MHYNEYNRQNLINAAKTFVRDDFVFFWGHTDRQEETGKSCLSQWHMCSFTVEDVSYNCAEQYMMAEKARIFGDFDAWLHIMASYDPMTIKKLGRKVRNFNAYVWKKNCQEVVKRGNLAKFSQNPKLMEYLLGTGDKILVEASPKDKIWGIGLAEDAPEACNPRLWQGENLLGFTLMKVRDMLRAKKENSADNVSEEDMKKALLMWTMGAGNSARRFNNEDPMPKKTKVAKPWGDPLDDYVSVPQDFYLTSRQMDIIRYGHMPDAMEDHCYMYCDDNAIHYLRSWTGFHIFEAHYKKCGDEYRITELRINNNPNEYRLSDAESAIALFYALLISEYGGDASAYWNAAF